MIFKQQFQCPALILARFTKPLDEIELLAAPQPYKKAPPLPDTEGFMVQPESILAMAQDILGAAKSDLSIHDNWFESGMDSIMASQLAHQINRKYKAKLVTTKDIFTHASAEQLAHTIRELRKQSMPSAAVQTTSAPGATTYPLSLQQQEIWSFINQAHEQEAYHLPIAIQIEGTLSKDTLQEAISQVIAHHDVLRCSFHTLLGQTNQHIHDDCFLILEYSEQYDEQELVAFYETPFDVTHPPLLKTRLLKKADGVYLWLVHFHHLICDGYTVRAFIHEVLKVYEGGVLANEPLQYSHFVSWQWEHVYYALTHTLKSYWYETLRDVPLTVPLAVETNLPMQAQVVSETLSLDTLKPCLQQLKQNKLSLSNFLLANLFDTLLDAFQHDKLGLVVFFSGRENSPFATVFGDTSNDVIITSHRQLDVFTHTQLLQHQILSKADQQYFRLPLLENLGLSKPMISFDFQRSIELNINTRFQLTMIKTSHVQHYLWGDEPRLLSFKAFLYKDKLNLALKYRTDKITQETAQTLLTSWVSHIIEAHLTVPEQLTALPGSFHEASALQTNLWALLKNHPNGLPYTIPVLKRLNPTMDLQRLETALQKTIQNHPSLRLSFSEHHHHVQWQIHPQAPVSIQRITTENLHDTLNSLLIEPINPEAVPLLRAYVLTSHQANEDPVFLIRLHHLVCDGISAEQFVSELETWYQRMDSTVLPSNKDEQYIHQHRMEKSSYHDNLQHYAHYIARLNSLLPPNSWMPIGSQEPTFMGGVTYQFLSAELSQKILSYCQHNRFSLYAFYLYVFCKTLHALVQQDTLYVSLVKSNRIRLEHQNAIGYYADNIPVLVEIDSSDDCINQITRLQINILELIEQYPHSFLERDLKEMDYKQPQFIFNQYKIDSQSPLFQAADHLLNELLERGGKQVVLWNYNNPEKLSLLVRSSEGGDLIGLAFNPHFFTADEANTFLSHLLEQLNAIIAIS